MTRMQFSPHSCTRTAYGHSGRPAINILHGDNELRIQMAVPGYKKDQIIVRVEDQTLHIEGNAPTQTDAGAFARREFSIKPFKQSLQLGDRVDPTAIQARVEDGLLTITLGLLQPLRREIAVA